MDKYIYFFNKMFLALIHVSLFTKLNILNIADVHDTLRIAKRNSFIALVIVSKHDMKCRMSDKAAFKMTLLYISFSLG